MDVRHLEMFVAIAEEGSIHGGARRLLIAQPAVSKALKSLERQIGTQLVVRSPQGIDLTPAGTVLFGEAQDILQRIGRAVGAVQRMGSRERTLKVGMVAGSIAAGELTADIIRAFRESNPDVRVSLRELSFADQFPALVAGDVDLALVRPPCGYDELALTPLFDEPLLLCVRADHKFAELDEIGVGLMLDEPLVDMPSAPRAWTAFWHLDELRNGPARTAAESVVTVSELLLSVACGSVITPVCSSAWRLSLSSDPLRAVPLIGAPRSQVAVASRVGDRREDIVGFTECARQVSRALIGKVPGATFIDADGQAGDRAATGIQSLLDPAGAPRREPSPAAAQVRPRPS